MHDQTHNENPGDQPCAWVREYTLSDRRLDGATLNSAIAMGPAIFADTLNLYAREVNAHSPELLAGDRDSCVVTITPDSDMTSAQPRTLAVCNGAGFTLALIVRANRLDVVDIGAAT